MLSIARNAAGDIYLDASGNLAMVVDEAAVAQNCVEAMKVRLGECILNLARGLPYFQAIWNNWLPAQFTAAARVQLLTVPNVTAVPSFTIEQVVFVDPNTGLQSLKAVYTATIENTFTDAALEISGTIPGASP